MTSRIDKLVREAGGLERLGEAMQLRAKPVTLFVNGDTSIALLRSTTALALRCFTASINVVGADGVSSDLRAAAAAEANEYGSPDRVVFQANATELALGLDLEVDGFPFVTASGWVAGVNRRVFGRTAAAPAAGFAAAAGVAKLFAKMLGAAHSVVTEAWQLSLWTLDSDGDGPDDIDIGRTLAIGAGAIGSGFGHIVRHAGWRGHVTFVDDQLYEEPNCETTMLISQQDARDCLPKAATLARLVAHTGVSAEGVRARIDESHPLLEEQWRAIVVGVDNAELRRALDHVQAPLHNAGVGGSSHDAGHVLWSRHDHSATDHFLSSLYRASESARESSEVNAPSDIEDACSRLEYDSVSLAAPFLGLAAGALLAAGVARQQDAAVNYFKLDLLGAQRHVVRSRRERR